MSIFSGAPFFCSLYLFLSVLSYSCVAASLLCSLPAMDSLPPSFFFSISDSSAFFFIFLLFDWLFYFLRNNLPLEIKDSCVLAQKLGVNCVFQGDSIQRCSWLCDLEMIARSQSVFYFEMQMRGSRVR